MPTHAPERVGARGPAGREEEAARATAARRRGWGCELPWGAAGWAPQEAARRPGAPAVRGLGPRQPPAAPGRWWADCGRRQAGVCLGPGQEMCFSPAASRGEERPAGREAGAAGDTGGSRWDSALGDGDAEERTEQTRVTGEVLRKI